MKKIKTDIGEFYTDGRRVYNENHMIMENNLKFFLEKINSLGKRKFDNPNYFFIPKEEDWKILKKDIFQIFLVITNNCNSKCRICWMNDWKFDEMNAEELKNILQKIGKRKTVILLGREPTTHPDIFNFISIINESKNFPELYTNGLKLADIKFVKKLKESNVRKVIISFDGFTEKIYKILRGDGNQLGMKLKALQNLKKYRIPTFLGFTLVDGLNNNQMKLILDFAIENNEFIKGLYFYGATPYSKFNVKMNRYMTTSDMIYLLEKESDERISMEYFSEFLRLKRNIRILMKKIGMSFSASSINVPYRINKMQFEEFLPINKIKEINKLVERKKYLSLIKYLHLAKYLKLKSYYDSFKEDVMWIFIDNINTPINDLQTASSFCSIGFMNGNLNFFP